MKLSEVNKTLEAIKQAEGDIPVQLMENCPTDGNIIHTYPNFFMVPEKYEDVTVLNIRSWPY